jgi:hypothetical protein
MPVELKFLILEHVTDIQTLRSLVHSSPEYHQAYLAIRREILYAFVEHAYRIEPNIAMHLEVHDFTEKPVAERWIALLDANRRQDEIPHPTSKLIDIEEMSKVLHFQKKIDFLIDDYCRTMPCPPWMDNEEWNDKILPLRLTSNERGRVLRAFYRVHTYCNMVGLPEDPDPRPRWILQCTNHGRTIGEWDGMWELFFGPMPPWEIEEYCCVWAYFRSKYVKIFEEVADDFSEFGTKNKDLTPEYMPVTFEIHPDGMFH